MRNLLIVTAAAIALDRPAPPSSRPCAGRSWPPSAIRRPWCRSARSMAARSTSRAASANSLWRTGARTFFGDQRARRIGDILTVNIDIDDRAQTQNSTNRTPVQQHLGRRLQLLRAGEQPGPRLPRRLRSPEPGRASRASPPPTDRARSTGRRGSSLTIAAVVTDVLSNGNMVIQGRQEVRTNRELRELTVAGIVRPEDITRGQHHQPHPDRRGPHQLRRTRRPQPRAGDPGGAVPGGAVQPILEMGRAQRASPSRPDAALRSSRERPRRDA